MWGELDPQVDVCSFNMCAHVPMHRNRPLFIYCCIKNLPGSSLNPPSLVSLESINPFSSYNTTNRHRQTETAPFITRGAPVGNPRTWTCMTFGQLDTVYVGFYQNWDFIRARNYVIHTIYFHHMICEIQFLMCNSTIM